MNDQAPEMYSEKEATAILGVSLSTLRRWRRYGIGPSYFRLGRVLRYSKEAVREFVHEHTCRGNKAEFPRA